MKFAHGMHSRIRRTAGLAAVLLLLLRLCSPVSRAASPMAEKEAFRILDEATGEILVVPDREFLYGAVVTEMTLYMNEEALKAQAAACYAFYSRIRAARTEEPFDFACNTETWWVYVPHSVMQAAWGERYPAYMEVLDRVADAVYGQLLTYEGEPACAAYFAVSCGKTENCGDVWGGNVPYLRAVASPWDAFSTGFLTEAAFSPEELAAAVGEASPIPAGNAEILGRTTGGSVTEVRLGEKTYTGSRLRSLLQLRSACFSVAWNGEAFVFSVRGYGHGVGMSQAGADALAACGATWQEILAWYYPGTELVVQT